MEEKGTGLFDFIALFLINLPAINPTKRNGVKPRNVIGHFMKILLNLIIVFLLFLGKLNSHAAET